MSFLDNLENTLKATESLEERDPHAMRREQQKKESQRAQAVAVQPYADQLRNGPFTSQLLGEATRIGHGLRTKVYITWIGSTLRLEARQHRMELHPTPAGIVARFTRPDQPEPRSEPVDLSGSAAELAERWLADLGPREPMPEVPE